MIRKENKSGPWTVTCDTKNSLRDYHGGKRIHELLVRERARALACRSLLVALRPGYQVFCWRAAQVQEVTGHIVQCAIWRNMRSLL